MFYLIPYVQTVYISTCIQYKKLLMRYLTFFFLTKSLKSSMHFTPTAHLSLGQPHFKRSRAICGSWLLCHTFLDDSKKDTP